MSVEIDLLERVESADTKGLEVPIHWEVMTFDHARNWHKNIQPSIKRDTRRADQNWNWNEILLLKYFYIPRGYSPLFLTAFVKLPNKSAVPVGMLLMLTRYPRIDSQAGGSVFTSFLTSAPKATLKRLGVSACPNMGRALIDCGIVTSFVQGKAGRTWLHCAPAGQTWLLDFYKITCGLHLYPKTGKLPVKNLIVPGNDGRHFFTDESLAARLAKDMDALRPQPVKAR